MNCACRHSTEFFLPLFILKSSRLLMLRCFSLLINVKPFIFNFSYSASFPRRRCLMGNWGNEENRWLEWHSYDCNAIIMEKQQLWHFYSLFKHKQLNFSFWCCLYGWKKWQKLLHVCINIYLYFTWLDRKNI